MTGSWAVHASWGAARTWAVLLVVGVAIYANSLGSPFVYDDLHF